MNLLLLIISIIFSFIFYAFHNLEILGKIFNDDKYVYYDFSSTSFFGNLTYEAIIFLVFGIFFFLLFSVILNKGEDNENNPYIKKWVKNNFKIILYYIGFMLFYLSIYIILKELYFNFFYIILIINLLIIGLYLIYKKLFIFSDLLKINTVIFSMIYIVIITKDFILGESSLFLIDYVNSFVIFISFFINLYSEKAIFKKKSDGFLLLNFFSYTLLFVSYYFNLIFLNTSFVFCFFAFILHFILLNFIKKVDFFKNSIITLKVLGIFFSYISIVSGIYYLQNFDYYLLEFLILAILLYLSLFNFKVHKLYENYTSFLFFIISLYFSLFYIYYNYIYLNNFNDLNLVLYGFCISLFTTLSTYFYKFKRIYDYYFIYFISIVISIISSIYYFYTNSFDFLALGIILLYDSIVFFLSYYKLKQIED